MEYAGNLFEQNLRTILRSRKCLALVKANMAQAATAEA